MSESISISSRSVAFWKTKGFAFAPAPGVVGCTQVTLEGKPFHYFVIRRAPTSAQLLQSLNIEMMQATDNTLIAAGEFDDDASFPWFLVTQESLELLKQARDTYVAALNAADRALGDFSDALVDPEGYNG
jgi:hypothetical protein